MKDLVDYYRVRADIDLDAIYNNMQALGANTREGTQLVAVIKTDGYGHGAVPIAKTIDNLVYAYAVATVDEALNLRKHGITKPIYILGFVHPYKFEEVIRNDIRPPVFDIETAQKLSDVAVKMGTKAHVNIKLDTGMSRIGFLATDDSVDAVESISKMPGIDIGGIFTHFSASDSKDKTSANRQLDIFKEFISKLESRGINISVKHCSNSAGIIDMHEANFNQVRAGIAIYGMYPSDEVDKSAVKLEPALSLKSHVVYIKEVEAGVGVSYGSTFVTDKKTKIATIPVGYGDGYPRNLSNKGYVLIKGNKCRILGRVCMDQFMVDVTGINVNEGDEVTLIGNDKDLCISVEELAEMAGTFNYEFVCDLGKRIPRVYFRHGKIVCTKDYFIDNYDVEDCK
ncbi:MAG: alanine racemase [Eubacterium sp.]